MHNYNCNYKYYSTYSRKMMQQATTALCAGARIAPGGRLKARDSYDNHACTNHWILCRRGCSGRGVQWMGVVSYGKIVHNTIQITTPCFHCTPLCRM